MSAWTVLPDSSYTYARETGVIEVAVAPQRMLRVAQLGTYTGHAADDETFGLVEIEMQGGGELIHAKGRATLSIFTKRSDLLYWIALE